MKLKVGESTNQRVSIPCRLQEGLLDCENITERKDTI